MKTLWLTSFVLAFSVAGFAASADEDAVRAAHAAFVKAAHAGDAAAMGKLLADGLQYSHSNAKLETKQECIAALAKSKANFEVLSETIHVYGNTATIRAKVTAHSANGDTPLAMLQVWIKKDGRWQMVERHTTRLPA